jgi:DNA-binding NarL/FixJ family response regulator
MVTMLPRSEGPLPTSRRQVLVVDDHPFFAACVRSLLDHESDFVVCDVAPTSKALDERVARLQPDVLVIDLILGFESGLESGLRLRQMNISTPILFVSTLAYPSKEQLSDIGRCSFIHKSRKPVHFLAALREILRQFPPARLLGCAGKMQHSTLNTTRFDPKTTPDRRRRLHSDGVPRVRTVNRGP